MTSRDRYPRPKAARQSLALVPTPKALGAGGADGAAAGIVDDLVDAIERTPDIIGDLVRPVVDLIGSVIEGLIRAWDKLTGFPRFVLVAFVLYRMTEREQRRIAARSR